VWKRTIGGRALHFRLAGINNQNFLMRDEETGSWWQQANGQAIFGALKGESLELAPYDELTFGLWKQESPAGQVLAPVSKDEKEYDSKWEAEIQKLPLVLTFPGTALQSRDVVIGLEVAGASRAYPMSAIIAQSPIQDRLGGTPFLLTAGPDGKSVRAFVSRLDGADIELFRKSDKWVLMDSASGSEWNFQGCATLGPAQGKCLERLPLLKDFWFDWRNYHPSTTVYRH
jgi:Protein of unknown function (DUF3179)